MSGFDTTDVAAKVNVQPFDAVKTMSGLAELNNLQNQNKMFQAKNLAGQYLAASTGPDGTIDQGKFSQFLANDHRVGPEIMAGLTGARGIQQTQAQIQQTQQTVAKAQRDAATGIVGSVYGTSPDPKVRAKNAISALAVANQNPNLLGGMSQDQIADFVGSGDWVHAAALNGAGGPGNSAAAVPAVSTVENAKDADGNPIVQTNLSNPVFGTVEKAGGNAAQTPLTMSAGEAATPVKVGIGTEAEGYPEIIAPKGSGALKGPTKASPPIGAAAAAETAGAESSKQVQTARADLVASKARILGIEQAQKALAHAGATGPGAEQLNTIKSFLNTNAPGFASIVGIDPSKIKSFDELHKYLTTYTLNRANSLGSLTGDKLAAAIAGNPSTHISTLANEDLLRVNKAIERMGQAGTVAFNKSGRPEGTYSKFISDWAHHVDPRAFGLDEMTAAERSKLDKSLSSNERLQLYNGIQAARAAEVLPPTSEWRK